MTANKATPEELDRLAQRLRFIADFTTAVNAEEIEEVCDKAADLIESLQNQQTQQKQQDEG